MVGGKHGTAKVLLTEALELGMINDVAKMGNAWFFVLFDIGPDQAFHELLRQDVAHPHAHAANRWFLSTTFALAPTLQVFGKVQEFVLAPHEVLVWHPLAPK